MMKAPRNQSSSQTSATMPRSDQATRPAASSCEATVTGTRRMSASSWARRMARPTASVGSTEAEQVTEGIGCADASGFVLSRTECLEDFHTHDLLTLRAQAPVPQPLVTKSKPKVNRSIVMEATVDQIVIVRRELAREVADLEIPRADRTD